MKRLFSFFACAFAIKLIFLISCTKDSGGRVNNGINPTPVHPWSPVSRPPVANAGPDQTIVWPISTSRLDGSGSRDPDNNIRSYQWTNISGPLSYTISNHNAVQPELTDLTGGEYFFELTVTDADGHASKDTVKITVLVLGNTELLFLDQALINQCYDPTPGVCWINGDSPSYGFYIRDTNNIFPNAANTMIGVWVKMDTSSVWELAPNNCWVFPDRTPQTNFTFCRTTDSLSVYTWFYPPGNLAGRKVDVKIRF